ncbi:unnamed protein product [Closterium sp. Yama58-4]|nr:unnamed protein product [Closterium sp. Yama58-4]
MLSREEGKAVCVLSTNGSVLPPTLSDGVTALPATPHGGALDVVSLSGSYVPNGPADASSRVGGLTATLVGADGRVLGGSVASPLLAFSTVQVTVLLFSVEPMGT